MAAGIEIDKLMEWLTMDTGKVILIGSRGEVEVCQAVIEDNHIVAKVPAEFEVVRFIYVDDRGHTFTNGVKSGRFVTVGDSAYLKKGAQLLESD